MDAEKVALVVKQRIRELSFFRKCFLVYNEVFTDEEVKLLVSFFKEIKLLTDLYKSEATKKMTKNGSKLFSPIL